ncbi:MAG: hypothetical protein N2449_10410 [Bacteroidales bacterium]|nr:hypothetical protein [Bacteroidales bacterium]
MKTFLISLFLFSCLFSYSQQVQNSLNKRQSVKLEISEVKVLEKKPEIGPCYPNEAYLKQNNVPDDFPRYIDTGNPKEDCARYHEAKQIWIQKNPERYEKIKHLKL